MDGNICDETDKPPNSFHVTYLDLGGLLYSIIFHFVDLGFDLYLAYAYYSTGKFSYFTCTVVFILLPTIIITLISIRMYVSDIKDRTSARHSLVRIVLCILGIIFQSAPFIRYCDSFRYAIKSLKAEFQSDRKEQEKYFNKMLNEDSDIALLRVFECYLESAPQQVLKTTLLLMDHIQGSTIHATKQFITITLGFIAMGWCMANYHRCIRFDQENKQNVSTLGTVVQFFWHLNFTVSRILAISAIGTLDTFWTSIAVFSHWCIMTVWLVISNKTHFCGKNELFEIFFYGTVGLVYVFNFISLREGPTRNSYLVFYILCFAENLFASVIWGVKSTPGIKNWVYYIFTILPVSCFLLSVVFLFLYYQVLHPNKLKLGMKNDNIFYGDNTETTVPEQTITLTNEVTIDC